MMTRVLSAFCLVVGAGFCASVAVYLTLVIASDTANIATRDGGTIGIHMALRVIASEPQAKTYSENFAIGAMLLMLGWVLRKT